MTRLKEYYNQVNEWKAKWPPPPVIKDLDLTKVKAGCFRCGSRGRSHRHHTGSDFFFASLLPHVFAARYIQYHPEDCEKLCPHCHRAAHKLARFVNLYREMHQERHRFYELNKRVDAEWCKSWMVRFRETFYEWCKEYKPRLKSMNKKR